MLQKFKQMITIMSMALLLFGCSANTPDTSNQTDSNTSEQTAEQEAVVVITISQDEGEEVLSTKEVSISEGDILMDVMKAHFDIEEDGGFITSIDGIAPKEDEKKAWMFFVNGDMAMVGAAEYELSAGDKVTFDLQSWE